MKKIILYFIFMISIFVLSNNESLASCPSGFTKDTVTIFAGNCSYYVEICFKCDVTNPGQVKINKIWLVDTTCYNSLNIELVIGQIYSEISTGSFIYSNLCPNALYPTPPCNETGTSYNQFEIIHNYCWQQYYRHNGVGPIREYIPCDDNAVCIETIDYCFDATGMEVIVIRRNNSSSQSPPCDLIWNEVTWPTVLGTKSDCFILNSVPCGIVFE